MIWGGGEKLTQITSVTGDEKFDVIVGKNDQMIAKPAENTAAKQNLAEELTVVPEEGIEVALVADPGSNQKKKVSVLNDGSQEPMRAPNKKKKKNKKKKTEKSNTDSAERNKEPNRRISREIKNARFVFVEDDFRFNVMVECYRKKPGTDDYEAPIKYRLVSSDTGLTPDLQTKLYGAEEFVIYHDDRERILCVDEEGFPQVKDLKPEDIQTIIPLNRQRVARITDRQEGYQQLLGLARKHASFIFNGQLRYRDVVYEGMIGAELVGSLPKANTSKQKRRSGVQYPALNLKLTPVSGNESSHYRSVRPEMSGRILTLDDESFDLGEMKIPYKHHLLKMHYSEDRHKYKLVFEHSEPGWPHQEIPDSFGYPKLETSSALDAVNAFLNMKSVQITDFNTDRTIHEVREFKISDRVSPVLHEEDVTKKSAYSTHTIALPRMTVPELQCRRSPSAIVHFDQGTVVLGWNYAIDGVGDELDRRYRASFTGYIESESLHLLQIKMWCNDENEDRHFERPLIEFQTPLYDSAASVSVNTPDFTFSYQSNVTDYDEIAIQESTLEIPLQAHSEAWQGVSKVLALLGVFGEVNSDVLFSYKSESGGAATGMTFLSSMPTPSKTSQYEVLVTVPGVDSNEQGMGQAICIGYLQVITNEASPGHYTLVLISDETSFLLVDSEAGDQSRAFMNGTFRFVFTLDTATGRSEVAPSQNIKVFKRHDDRPNEVAIDEYKWSALDQTTAERVNALFMLSVSAVLNVENMLTNEDAKLANTVIEQAETFFPVLEYKDILTDEQKDELELAHYFQPEKTNYYFPVDSITSLEDFLTLDGRREIRANFSVEGQLERISLPIIVEDESTAMSLEALKMFAWIEADRQDTNELLSFVVRSPSHEVKVEEESASIIKTTPRDEGAEGRTLVKRVGISTAENQNLCSFHEQFIGESGESAVFRAEWAYDEKESDKKESAVFMGELRRTLDDNRVICYTLNSSPNSIKQFRLSSSVRYEASIKGEIVRIQFHDGNDVVSAELNISDFQDSSKYVDQILGSEDSLAAYMRNNSFVLPAVHGIIETLISSQWYVNELSELGSTLDAATAGVDLDQFGEELQENHPAPRSLGSDLGFWRA